MAQPLVALVPSRSLEEVRFYTGVYRQTVDALWHGFGMNKLDYLEMYVYRGKVNSIDWEKGVDVSLALHLVEATHYERYEVPSSWARITTSARRCTSRRPSPESKGGNWSSSLLSLWLRHIERKKERSARRSVVPFTSADYRKRQTSPNEVRRPFLGWWLFSETLLSLVWLDFDRK